MLAQFHSAINSAQEIKTRALQAPDQALDSKPP